jgi:hypothetical protein
MTTGQQWQEQSFQERSFLFALP